MPGKHKVASPSPIERDFLEALARLAAGKPSNAELKRLTAQGKLRISVTTVAKEAGRARTLIAHDACKYPAVLMQVLEYMKPVVNPRDGSAMITRLREDVADLKSKLRDAQAEVLAHFHARQRAERVAARSKDAYERLLRKRSEPFESNVVSFPAREDDQSGNEGFLAWIIDCVGGVPERSRARVGEDPLASRTTRKLSRVSRETPWPTVGRECRDPR